MAGELVANGEFISWLLGPPVGLPESWLMSSMRDTVNLLYSSALNAGACDMPELPKPSNKSISQPTVGSGAF